MTTNGQGLIIIFCNAYLAGMLNAAFLFFAPVYSKTLKEKKGKEDPKNPAAAAAAAAAGFTPATHVDAAAAEPERRIFRERETFATQSDIARGQ